MDPEKKKFERLILPTKYVIPKSLKFNHWPSKSLIPKPGFSFLCIDPPFGCQISGPKRYVFDGYIKGSKNSDATGGFRQVVFVDVFLEIWCVGVGAK